MVKKLVGQVFNLSSAFFEIRLKDYFPLRPKKFFGICEKGRVFGTFLVWAYFFQNIYWPNSRVS
jgi:hypothetical protein